MPITPTTIKRLFARSGNRCAMPRCQSVLVNGEHVLAETIRIAFSWEPKVQKVVIGFIGQHQRNAHTN